MSRILTLWLAATFGLILAAPACAEIIVLPNGHIKAARLAHQPTRGMSMQQVIKRFGEPLRKLPPTVTAPHYPTITRWVYKDYTVYFADKHVIHTVVHPAQRPAPGKS